MASRLDISIDTRTKQAVNKLYQQLGISLSSAVKLFFAQSLHDQGLPFRPTISSNENIQARHEADHPESLKSFHTVNDLWKDLNN